MLVKGFVGYVFVQLADLSLGILYLELALNEQKHTLQILSDVLRVVKDKEKAKKTNELLLGPFLFRNCATNPEPVSSPDIIPHTENYELMLNKKPRECGVSRGFFCC